MLKRYLVILLSGLLLTGCLRLLVGGYEVEVEEMTPEQEKAVEEVLD